MHFYDLFNALKDDADFFLVYNSNKRWHYEARPLPENAQFVPYYEKGKYDLAILDIDQQCANPKLGKTKLFMELNELIQDIPKVIINHGSPCYPEFDGKSDDDIRKIIKKMVGDTPMVVNSFTAASDKEWGWGYPIWHGINPDDWWDLPKEPRVFTALSPGGCNKYYNRECMNEVAQILDNKYKIKLWWAKINTNPTGDFDKYREFLGRSLVYLDTSFRTPMNRARTEAMLSGCHILQVEGYHDQEKLTKEGLNLFTVKNNAKEIAGLISLMINNQYNEVAFESKEIKQKAKDIFSYKRFRQNWLNFLNTIL